MTSNDPIEVTAQSVDEAVRQALDQLGAAEDEVVIEILNTPRSGVLGLGARQARVRVKRRTTEAVSSPAQSPPHAPPSGPRPPARAELAPDAQRGRGERGGQSHDRRSERTARPGARPSSGAERSEGAREDDTRQTVAVEDQARDALQRLSQLLEMMGESATAAVTASDAEAIEIEVTGDGSGILIGRHGQTLDAIEYLVNRMVARQIKEPVPILIDTESYRARRGQQLERMALSMGERAKREHQPVVLDPMPPRDRRIIHLALKDDPLLSTRSAGAGYLRSVEIVPAQTARDTRPRERGRAPEPDDAPIGQQGGFKHGQKRIV